jgi:hypothetical protein
METFLNVAKWYLIIGVCHLPATIFINLDTWVDPRPAEKNFRGYWSAVKRGIYNAITIYPIRDLLIIWTIGATCTIFLWPLLDLTLVVVKIEDLIEWNKKRNYEKEDTLKGEVW